MKMVHFVLGGSFVASVSVIALVFLKLLGYDYSWAFAFSPIVIFALITAGFVLIRLPLTGGECEL